MTIIALQRDLVEDKGNLVEEEEVDRARRRQCLPTELRLPLLFREMRPPYHHRHLLHHHHKPKSRLPMLPQKDPLMQKKGK